MSYYLKHLFRAIKKKPLQPLLIIVILLIACAMSTSIFITSTGIKKDCDLEVLSNVGNSQLILESVPSSGSRFLTIKDVKDVDADCTAIGTFNLPFLMGESLVSGIGCDLEEVNTLFDFELLEIQDIKKSELSSSVIISKRFAKNNDIKLGDEISFSLFGKDIKYTVKGINKYTFFGTNDVLVDMNKVISILSEDMSIVEILGESIEIYNTIYVKTNLDNIAAKELFESKLTNVDVMLSEEFRVNKDQDSYVYMAFILVLISIVFAFAVVYGCSYCLSKERAEYSYLFSLAGFSEKKLLFYRILEVVIYWFIGMILGLALSILVGHLTCEKIGFVFFEYSLDFWSVLICTLGLLIATILSPILLSVKIKKRKLNINKKKILIVVGIILVILLILSFTIFHLLSFVIGVLGTALTLMFVYVFSEELLKAISKKVSSRKNNVIKVISYKNCERVGELINSCKLLSILVCIILMGCVFLNGSISGVYCFGNMLSGDYIIMGANSQVVEIVSDIDEVDSIYGMKVCDKAQYENGEDITLWAFENISNINSNYGIDKLPNEGEIIITGNYAKSNGCNFNGEYSIKIPNGEININKSYAIEYLGILAIVNYNDLAEEQVSYIVTKKEGVSSVELYDALTSKLSSQMVSIVKVDEMAKYNVQNNKQLVLFCSFVVIMLIVFGVIGIANNFVESYRSRKEELYSYNISGMSKRNIKKLLINEYLNIIIQCLILGIIFAILGCVFSTSAMKPFGGNPLVFILRRLVMIYFS